MLGRSLALPCSLALLVSCGSAPPPRSRALPEETEVRDAAVMALGSELWGSLLAADAFATLATDEELAELVDSAGTTRLRLRRPGIHARIGEMVHGLPARLEGATYAGICAQDAHDEPRGGALGMQERTWVIGRVLVAGHIPGGSRRIALWVDGPFAYDGERFVALEISDIEEPRWEHSDLELGVCDLSEGL